MPGCWGTQHWKWAAGEGSCSPLSWHRCPQYARDLGLAGSPSWQPASPCAEAPAQPCRQDQGLALCTLCLAPIKHHGLRSPSCGSRDKWLGQNSRRLFRAQRFFGQEEPWERAVEPWERAAEPGRCPLPHNVSCLRTPHSMGVVGSESLAEAVGATANPFPSTHVPSPTLLLHLASYARTMCVRTLQGSAAAGFRTIPSLCWV